VLSDFVKWVAVAFQIGCVLNTVLAWHLQGPQKQEATGTHWTERSLGRRPSISKRLKAELEISKLEVSKIGYERVLLKDRKKEGTLSHVALEREGTGNSDGSPISPAVGEITPYALMADRRGRSSSNGASTAEARTPYSIHRDISGSAHSSTPGSAQSSEINSGTQGSSHPPLADIAKEMQWRAISDLPEVREGSELETGKREETEESSDLTKLSRDSDSTKVPGDNSVNSDKDLRISAKAPRSLVIPESDKEPAPSRPESPVHQLHTEKEPAFPKTHGDGDTQTHIDMPTEVEKPAQPVETVFASKFRAIRDIIFKATSFTHAFATGYFIFTALFVELDNNIVLTVLWFVIMGIYLFNWCMFRFRGPKNKAFVGRFFKTGYFEFTFTTPAYVNALFWLFYPRV